VISWQTIRTVAAQRLQASRQRSPLQALLSGLVIFVLFILLLLPIVAIGGVVLIVGLIRGGVRALLGSAVAALPRDDGRRNVRVRGAERSGTTPVE